MNCVQEKFSGIACLNRLQMSESEFIDRLKHYIEIEISNPFHDQSFLGFLLDVADFAYEKEEDRINCIASGTHSDDNKQCLCPGGIGVCGYGDKGTNICHHPQR